MSETSYILSLGDVVDGKYAIESVLGRGGMGVVYRARHLELDAPRAIKVMHRELAQSEDLLARFRNEARLAEELRHPNIVTLYDLSPLPDGTPYIVWEYVEGETLALALHRGVSFAPEQAVELVAQVASGLGAAHERDIVHRDISPDNLMITRDAMGARRLKVLDFGLAKLMGSMTDPGSGITSLGVFLGKIGYSSPEQAGLIAHGEPLDRRADVFSLAVVAYRLLAGRLPFRTTSIQAFLYDLTTAPEGELRERFTEGLDPVFRSVFSRALRRDRDQRTPSMEELRDDLQDALCEHGQRAGAARVRRHPETARRRSIRRRLLWATLVAVALLVGLLPVAGLRRAAPVEPRERSPREIRSEQVSSGAPALPQRIDALPERPLSLSPSASEIASPPDRTAPVEPPILDTASVRLDAGGDQEPVGEPQRERSERASDHLPKAADELPGAAHALNAHGSLSITSDVWVEVRLDDGAPEETPSFFQRVPTGTHELRITRRGEPERVLTVVIREGETTAVRLVNGRQQ